MDGSTTDLQPRELIKMEADGSAGTGGNFDYFQAFNLQSSGGQ